MESRLARKNEKFKLERPKSMLEQYNLNIRMALRITPEEFEYLDKNFPNKERDEWESLELNFSQKKRMLKLVFKLFSEKKDREEYEAATGLKYNL